MQYSFGLSEVEKWAKFSGDYNPIHFNLEEAKNAGLNGLILHGMLALMPVKQAVSKDYIQENPGDVGWMKFRALFRNPIAHDGLVSLGTKPWDNGLTFRICAYESKHEHFRGAFTPVEDPTPQVANSGVEVNYSTILCSENLGCFSEYYPGIKERWIELDAIIFSEFIRSKMKVVEDMTQLYGANKGKRSLFQISHSVIFDKSYFSNAQPDESDWRQISYGITVPEMIISDDQLIGTVSLPVMTGGRLVMLLEIGLIAKYS